MKESDPQVDEQINRLKATDDGAKIRFMDDEKLEKTMEFILNNQAQFTIDIQNCRNRKRKARSA
jgi:hypothetical protein